MGRAPTPLMHSQGTVAPAPASWESEGEDRMSAVRRLVKRLVGHDEGQDLIEYGLVVALVSLIAVVSMTAVGNVVNQVLWQTIAAMMNGV